MTKAASWNVVAGSAANRAIPQRRRLHREAGQTKAARLAIVVSLFLVLLTAAFLVGGRTIIDSLLQPASTDGAANRIGDVVFTMPDGKFCRHLSFDNKTAEIVEGAIEQCAADHVRGSVSRAQGFTWGTR